MLRPGDRVTVKDLSFAQTWDSKNKCYSHIGAKKLHKKVVTVVKSKLLLPGEEFLHKYYPNDTIVVDDSGTVFFVCERLLEKVGIIKQGSLVKIKPGYHDAIFTVASVDENSVACIRINSNNVVKYEG